VSTIFRQLLSYWPHGALSGAATLAFLGVFLAVIYRTFGPRGRKTYAGIETLPQNDLPPLELPGAAPGKGSQP
jgi:cbb3-type cytochrome oxidase subunit 3